MRDNAPYLHLRTDGFVVSNGSDEILHFFPGYSASFKGISVTRAIEFTYSELEGKPQSLEELCERAIHALDFSPDFIRYIVTVLVSQRCLYWSDSPLLSDAESELVTFLKSHSPDWQKDLNLLSSTKVMCISHSDDVEFLTSAFEKAGLNVSMHKLERTTTSEQITRILDEAVTHPIVAVWGFPYELPLLDKINTQMVAMSKTCIYGYCAGGVGRVGPTTMGKNVPCLKCIKARHESNAGPNSVHVAAEFSRNLSPIVPMRWASLPLLNQLVVASFAFELTRLATSGNALTLGAYLEYDWKGGYTRRSFIRFPRCSTCGSSNPPPRYPWSISLPLPPTVDSTAHE